VNEIVNDRHVNRLVDADRMAARYRLRSIRPATRELLMARISGSAQEQDLSAPPNCHGLGRLRHFHRSRPDGAWGPNPLPIDPAQKALSLPRNDTLVAQAFQNSACNWRCWYCYVPFDLLAADESRSFWTTADALISMFGALVDRPKVIDLTGGQPDLVPEWIPWTMDAIENQCLTNEVYLWSDDNLSNDYFWRYLSDRQIERISNWKNYGRVCCFKGFDSQSFEFNTASDGAFFRSQFDLFGRLLALGLDLYAYVTLTTPILANLADSIARFVDALQEVHPNLPLRTVPLPIQIYSPVQLRMKAIHHLALKHQEWVVAAFRKEIQVRFSSSLRQLAICDVPFGRATK
jgi:uncharacterized Fe-S cluster-containing radical SAM superfamily protein